MTDKEPEDDMEDLDRLESWMDTEGFPKTADIFGKNDWVEKFVRRAVSKAVPKGITAGMTAVPPIQSKVKTELFETHHFVIIKCQLGRQTKTSNIRVYVRADRVKITGLSGAGDKIIKLPAIVDPYDSRALCRDRILQIKVRKRALDRLYHEVDIRF